MSWLRVYGFAPQTLKVIDFGLTRKSIFYNRPYAFVSPGPIIVVAWSGRI